MDAHSLALFVDIVEAGNLSQAARHLKMSRANVSYHLAQLEKAVGLELLRRTTRRVELTEAGERLLRHGRAIRDEVQAAREAVTTLGKGLHGAVRISLPTGFGQLVMGGWLIEFKRLHPDIALDLVFDNRVDDLLDKEVDLAVRVMGEPPQHLVAVELTRVRFVTCAAADWARAHGMPQAFEDLSRVPLITSMVSGRDLRVSGRRGEERRELTLHPTLASENFQFLREAILAGLGVGFAPTYLVAQDLAAGRLVTALDDWRISVFGTRMYLLRMPQRYQTLAARTLIDFVVQKARAWADGEEAASPQPASR
jgi:DNA-binding transcriptional LysR family regulator